MRDHVVPHTLAFLLTGTAVPAIEEAFSKFTARADIGIVLINQHVRSSKGVGVGSRAPRSLLAHSR